jgi:hypothetical protein
VPAPGAAIEDPIGALIEPIGGADAGCVVDPLGVGVLDVLPQAVGCGLAASDPLEPAPADPASLEPRSEPVVAAAGCA